MDGEFTYLGRCFSFESKPDSIKAALEQKLKDLLNIASSLKIKAQTMIKILSLYIHAQMLHDIKLNDLPLTWIEQTLDALCVRHIRDWLEMSISACQRNHVYAHKNGRPRHTDVRTFSSKNVPN